MATPRFETLMATLIATLAALLAVSSAARPCKTILFISTTASSSSSSFDSFDQRIPKLPFLHPLHRPRSLTFFFTQIRQIDTQRPFFLDKPRIVDAQVQRPRVLPLRFDQSPVASSVRDRTMDIMGIVGALLFGLGFGALTAAGMFLVWYMCSPRNSDFADSDDDEPKIDFSPKKIGYVAIPTAVSDDNAKLPPAKEAV